MEAYGAFILAAAHRPIWPEIATTVKMAPLVTRYSHRAGSSTRVMVENANGVCTFLTHAELRVQMIVLTQALMRLFALSDIPLSSDVGRSDGRGR